jgi:uncharacterized protein (TIGR02391 family)
MAKLPDIPTQYLKPLTEVLGKADKGEAISRTFHELGIEDRSGESTKWKRLHHAFVTSQKHLRSSNQIYAFIASYMAPVRFVGAHESFEQSRDSLNAVLSFLGVEFCSDGKFRQVKKSETLSDAEKRYQTIRQKFLGRRLHPEVVKYCSAELMVDNYFHAVFEASKGLAQRIRELSGADGDGAKLVDAVFSVDRPILAINSLQTETERTEHKGFAQLLKGAFAAVRNPLAHEPRILWEGEEDAADYFSLLSLLHRGLDKAVPTGL